MDTEREERPLARPVSGHRHALTVVAVLAACALVAGGATGIRAILTRTARHAVASNPATACVAPQTPPTVVAPNHIGGWKFSEIEAGTFASVIAAPPSTLYAIQACGAEETALRIISINLKTKAVVVSGAFARAALLTSSLTRVDGSLYFGAARLDLSGGATAPPYELTLYRLEPATLKVVGERPLGRGYGLTLAAAQNTIVASTGHELLTVDPSSLASREVLSFGKSVAQHMSLLANAGSDRYVAVNLFSPAAVPPAESARIELVDLANGGVVSSIGLPSGSDPESLSLGPSGLWASVGDGLSTVVTHYETPSLTQATAGDRSHIPASLQTLSLDTGRGVIWVRGLTYLSCADPATGHVLASTVPSGSPPPSVNQIVTEGSTIYAVTQSAIGLLAVPGSCQPA